jgi:outer membrane protein OmpA-like peptidoglycan-associated protein/Tol biopolymer transport system component
LVAFFWPQTIFLDMCSFSRILFFSACVLLLSVADSALAQGQDKEQAKLYLEQAELILAETKAEDDARDLMVTAANYDTTFIKANFEAGHLYLKTIGKDLAVKYFLRIYRQDPDYRFDIEYWVATSYQFGLEFDKAIDFFTRYKNKLTKKPNYQGKDKVDMKEVDRRITECKNGKEFVANPKPFSIVNIGREINSEFEDYAPVLNASEDEIVFTTRRRDGNTYENVADDNKPFEDIFTTTRSNGNWQKAKNIGPSLNTNSHDSNLAFSPDGNMLFVYKDVGNGDIYFTERKKDGTWSELEALPGIINSTYRESSVSITKDGELLYFASERPGGYGASDIYVCYKDSRGEWTRVKNLGPTINTEYDEDGPFIDYDGKTMYFSSQGRKGMGGFDIFKANLLDKEKNEWSEPENMGYPINSPDDDIYFSGTKDGKRWYYSSVRADGLGYSDIYKIEPSSEEKKAPPVVAVKEPEPVIETPNVEPVKEPVKEPVVEEVKPKVEPKPAVVPFQYVVNVVDADSKNPLDAKVRMQGLKDNVMVGMEDLGGGSYKFSIVATKPKDYRLSVEKEGYVFQTLTVKIDGANAKEKTITKTIELRKLSVGVVSILRNIYFDFEKATFKTEAYPELNKLETMMKQNTGLQVEIGGHTDSVGDNKFNLDLSLRRANAVKSFLTSKGVDPRRIKTVGYGETKPLASNDDEEEGRQFNRRVEFKVLGK